MTPASNKTLRAAARLSTAAGLIALGLAAGAELGPALQLRLSETLSKPPASSEPAAATVVTLPLKPRRKKTELSLTGSLSAWSGTRRLDAAEAVAVPRLAAKLYLPLSLGLSLSAEGDVSREQANRSEFSRSKATLREGFISGRHEALSARIGWQIINWGRTDVINPTDNVAARDYTRLVDTDADQKLGVPSANLTYRIGDKTSAQAIWQPRFRATTIPLPAVAGLRYREDDRPDHELDSGGLRIDTVGERLSWSLSYFRGPAKRPNLAPTVSGLAAGVLALNHPLVSTFGADAEILVGKWVLRSETAYNRFQGSGQDPIASRESFVESVLGLERSFGQASAFVQADVRHTFDYLDPRAQPAPLAALALGNASINEELHRTFAQIGGGFALNTADLRWSASFDLAWFPGDGDFVVRPRLRYRYSDLVTLWGGADYFDGPAAGIYGRLHRNTAAFVGISGALSRRW